MEIEIRDVEANSRFEAWVGSELAGFAEYERDERLVVYPHTVVDPRFEGKGVGSALARAALDDARSRGLAVRATCVFIHGWMARHPEYADLARQDGSQASG
ncbi:MULTISPECIES: GNAT family N-acetyltransferase [Kitasatospora]|uniref:GNAT family N-acetyltransferase n=1 Tax=Kitasatospora TaxID=2063 RepID=UPI000C70A050|nr:GNAT family N-acetyltransferase [Kitasatospora sp. GP30]MDH6143730.1 putative GNAT family acetyltransferase [Kitasatospora sp. GP30]